MCALCAQRCVRSANAPRQCAPQDEHGQERLTQHSVHCFACGGRSALACVAYRDALHGAARGAVRASAALAAALVAARGETEAAAAVRAPCAAVLEACAALRAAPRDGRAATCRALVRRGAAVKDAAREATELAGAPTREEGDLPSSNGHNEDNIDDDDGDSCDYDAAPTAAEAACAAAAAPLLAAALNLLQPLLRVTAAAGEVADGGAVAAALDGALASYDEVAGEAEAFAAALWPPQEAPLLRRHAAALAAAAQRVPAAAAALQMSDGELARALGAAAAAVADAHRAAAPRLCADVAPMGEDD